MSDIREAVVSAPGKFLLAGELQVALDNNPLAYSAALDRRVYSRAFEKDSPGITVWIPQFALTCKINFQEDRIVYSPPLSREQRELFRYIDNALILTRTYLKETQRGDVDNIGIMTVNDSGFLMDMGLSKARFGSSSAATVAVIGSLFEYYERNISDADQRLRIHNLAQLAHYYSQRWGSGYDVSTAVHGSQVFMGFPLDKIPERKSLTPDKLVEFVDKESKPKFRQSNFPNEVGTSIAYTQGVRDPYRTLSAVRNYREKHAHVYGSVMNGLREATKEFIDRLDSRAPLPELSESFQRTRSFTKAVCELAGVDIEPETVTRAFGFIEGRGGSPKLQGAGGGYSAIALCAPERVEELSAAWWSTALFTPLADIEIEQTGERGLRRVEGKHFKDILNRYGIVYFPPTTETAMEL